MNSSHRKWPGRTLVALVSGPLLSLAACEGPPPEGVPADVLEKLAAGVVSATEAEAGAEVEGAALAEPTATVRGCLNGTDGPYDLVSEWNVNGKRFRLWCGDPTKGVLHIDRDHGPLDQGRNDSYFLNCLDRIFISGRRAGVGSVPGTHVYEFAYFDRHLGHAYALVKDSNGYILTAFARRVSKSNDWFGCNNGS